MTENTSGIPAAVRLHQALDAAGLPVAGVGREKDSDKLRLDWSQPPSAAQAEQAGRILAEFDPSLPEGERLALNGVGAEQMLAALWARVVENDERLVQELQAKFGRDRD